LLCLGDELERPIERGPYCSNSVIANTGQQPKSV